MDEDPDREARPKVSDVSAEQAESFGILRRPQVDSDRFPLGRAGMFEGGRLGLRGLNPGLARRVVTLLGDVWVVPGNGCIALYDGSATCNPTEYAIRRGMVMWGSSRRPHQESVIGLVPDGVSHVTLQARDGESTAVAVDENVYAATLTGGFGLVRFDGPAGSVEQGPLSR